MNNVHGVAVDVETRRVFVNDRDNHRIQIFDENGKYLSEWSIKMRPSSLHFVVIGDDRTIVTFDRNTHKMLKYDLDGRLIYSWGTDRRFPRHAMGRARHGDRSGGQPLRRRGRLRALPEVQPAPGRQSRDPDRQADLFGVAVKLVLR